MKSRYNIGGEMKFTNYDSNSKGAHFSTLLNEKPEKGTIGSLRVGVPPNTRRKMGKRTSTIRSMRTRRTK